MNAIYDLLTSHASGESKLRVRTFTVEDDEFPLRYVLVEGSADDLRFLAEVILSHANLDTGCSWGFHPNSAGSAHFSRASTIGIYLHKLPCDFPDGHLGQNPESEGG